MTDKIVLTNIANLQNENTAVNSVNTNNESIIAAVNNTLSRDGTYPNQMQTILDMNSHQIINLPSPTSNTSPVRLMDLNGGTVSISPIPSGGTTGQVLTKISSANFDANWQTTGATISVKTYGAKGDGVTDDTANIQIALNDTNVGTLYFPKGTYMLNANGLAGTSNKKWKGDGVGVTTIKMSTAPTLDMIYFSGCSNFSLEGITFDGNGKLTNIAGGNYPTLQPCIGITGSTRFVIRDCEFIGFFTSAILTNVSNNLLIQNNILTRATASTGAGMTSGNGGMQILGTGTPDAGNAYNFVIDGNKCTNCQISVSGHDGSITNNVVTGWGFSAGINSQGLTSNYNLFIGGNHCHDSNQSVDSPGGYYPAGIENWAANSCIIGNTCNGNFGSGIDCGGPECTIIGNNCYNNGTGGAGAGGITMYAQDATFNSRNCVIEGNNCTDTRVGGARTQVYGYFEHPNITTYGVTGLAVGINRFENNITGPMFLQALARPASLAANIVIPSSYGFSGGTHQNVSTFSLATGSGFTLGVVPTGTLTANRTLSISVGDGSRVLSLNGGDVNFGGQFVISGASALTLNTSGTTNLTIPAGTSTLVTTGSNLGVFSSTTSAQLAGVMSDETGTGLLVFNNAPALTSPVITGGAANSLTVLSLVNSGFNMNILSGGSLTANRNLTFTVNDAARTVSLSGNVTTAADLITSGANSLTLTTTGSTNVTLPVTGTLATLAGIETFTNKTLTSPTMTTPTLGVATATTINKVTITAPATNAILTIPNGVTLTGPASSGTAMTLGNAETITGAKTFGTAGNVGQLIIAGTTSGTTVLNATAVASGTLTLPAATDTLVGKATTDTLTNKTLTSPTLTTPVLGTPSSGTLTNCTGLPLAGLATQAAFTLVGNNTSGTAVPTAVDISLLTAKASPAATDLVMISDQAASGAWKKATVSSVASAGSVSSIAGNTGAFTLSTGITNSTNDIRLNRGHLPGETSNGSAAAGEIGEYVESVIVTGSAISPATSTTATVTSISLTAGDWDVSGIINYKGGTTTTVNFVFAGLSLVAATLDTTPGRYTPAPVSGSQTFFTGGNEFAVPIPPYRFSLSGTTTIYLVTQHSYATSTMAAYGLLRARRMR